MRVLLVIGMPPHDFHFCSGKKLATFSHPGDEMVCDFARTGRWTSMPAGSVSHFVALGRSVTKLFLRENPPWRYGEKESQLVSILLSGKY
jgi:hypothetical protein